MKIFYDTEFLEDGRSIELISIGMIAEDGRELYLCNRDAPWRRIHKHAWLVENVLPGLPRLQGERRLQASVRRNPAALDFSSPLFVPRDYIATHVRRFVRGVPAAELWADYGAYDHVALCQLYGPMVALPAGIPMWTNDFQQAWQSAGRPDLPPQRGRAHNALDDARHLRAQYAALAGRT